VDSLVDNSVGDAANLHIFYFADIRNHLPTFFK
jgi:hypothetical protein